ncbi:MAG: SWIM zinc finger family protein, partial [Treponema sp.]|nr:SWIM zinc finger family protein [Treponema sp.]
MKNLYGITPWGRWFVDILDSYQMGERLDRGRRYANAGKVLSLEINAGRVIAKVEGNYSPFYKVIISFPPLDEAEKVYKLIEKDPPLMARIAAGELPETFLEKLKNDGINLIPRRWRDMKRSCSCPDYGDPCKHMAALYYIIAREIDANPHVLFRLRGMDLQNRFGKAVVHKISPPFTITFSKKEKNNIDSQIADSNISNEPLEFEEIPHCGLLISSLLPPDPPFCGRNFAAVMAEFFHRCAGIQEWESVHDDSDNEDVLDNTEHNFSRSHWTVHCPSLVPGVEPVLQALDINGRKNRYTLYEAFNYFVRFASEDGTASYSFLFYLFKFLNLVCSAGAIIPYVLVSSDNDIQFNSLHTPSKGRHDASDEEILKIIWRPFENLPQISNMLKAIALRECGMLTSPPLFKINLSNKQVNTTGKQAVSERSVVDILTSAFLNEWVRNKFMLFRDEFSKSGDNEYRQLLNLFFMGMFIDVSSPAKRSLPMAIDRWLSVLHINFSAFRYAITIKDLSKQTDDSFKVMNFSISMDVITEDEEGRTIKTPLSKCKDLDILRAPIALSNYLPEIKDLFTSQKIALSETRLVSFLDSASSLLTRLGMTVNLPKALARELKPRLVIKGKTDGSSLVKYLDL